MKTMKKEEVIEILERHNRWRRDDLGIEEMIPPNIIGEAIDGAVKLISGTCEWKYTMDNGYYYYHPGCRGSEFEMRGFPVPGEYEYCHYCGKKLKIHKP